MKFPSKDFIKNVTPKKVYYFSSQKLNTTIPHYFICMSKSEDEIYGLVCCTTKFEKRKRYFDRNNINYKTLVPLKPDGENGIEEESFIDCNTFFTYSASEFKIMYENNTLDYRGEVSNTNFEQIAIGLLNSEEIEEYIKEDFKDFSQYT